MPRILKKNDLIARLIKLLHGICRDDMIYWIILAYDMDPNMAAHKLLDRDPVLMKKRPMLNQGASSSRTPGSTESNSREGYKKLREDGEFEQYSPDVEVSLLVESYKKLQEDEEFELYPRNVMVSPDAEGYKKSREEIEFEQYPPNVMVSLLEEEYNKLRETPSVAALVRSTPILEALERTSVGQLFRTRSRLTPNETREADEWVNSIFNECPEGDSEIASGQNSESAAPSTNPVFSSNEPVGTLPLRPIFEASDRNLDSQINRQSEESESSERIHLMTLDEVSEGNGETAYGQNSRSAAPSTSPVFPSGQNSTESATPSTNPVFPSHETDRVSDPQALPHWNLTSIESHLMEASGSTNFTLPTDEISGSSASSNARAVYGNEVVPSYVGGNNLNLQQNIPQQFRGFSNNVPSQSAVSQSPLSIAIYGNLSQPEYGGGGNFLERRRRPRRSLASRSTVAGNNNTQFPTGSISSTTSLTGLEWNVPQQFRPFLNNTSSAYAGTSAIPEEGVVSQYIRREENNKLQNLLYPKNKQNLNSRSMNEQRVSGTSQGRGGRDPTAQQPFQMNQQHVRRDPTAQQPLQMNQQHVRDPTAQQPFPMNQQNVRRDPTDSSQSIPQGFTDLLLSGDYPSS